MVRAICVSSARRSVMTMIESNCAVSGSVALRSFTNGCTNQAIVLLLPLLAEY